MTCIQCGNKVIENRELVLCGSCNALRRKEEREDRKPAKVVKSVRKISPKRKEKLKEYKPMRENYLIDHPECEVKLIGCDRKSIEIHHCSTSDKDFLNEKTWKAVCRHCHDKIEFFESAISRRENKLLI